jgi:hypothetical protein
MNTFKLFSESKIGLRIRAGGLLLLLLGAVSAAVPAEASFEDVGTGARASGLGGAFTSIADDVHALYYNPAGLVYLRRKEFAATYGLLHTGLEDGSKIGSSYIAYGHPMKETIGTMGLSWQQLSLDSLYTERAITLGYGRRLSQKWAAGLNLKQLYRQFTAPAGQTDNLAARNPNAVDPVFMNGNSQSSYGVDFGLLFRPFRNYSYGLLLQNLNEPNMAIASGDRDIVPMLVRSGVAYTERNLTLIGEIDTQRKLGSGRDTHFTAGAEKWWVGAGFAQGDIGFRGSLAFGSRNYSQITMGLSYRLEAIQIDYGFLMPLGGITFGGTQGNHRITFSLRFGKTIAEPDYELRMRAAENAAKKAEEELEAARKESEQLARQLERMKEVSQKRRVTVEEIRQKSGNTAAVQQLSERFAEAMDQYWRRKSAGASVNERIALLSQILQDFENTEIDLSIAQSEYEIAKSDRAKAEMDLQISWNYYQKIVARGASVPERIQLLGRMIERFARTGVDLNNLKTELKSLQGGR